MHPAEYNTRRVRIGLLLGTIPVCVAAFVVRPEPAQAVLPETRLEIEHKQTEVLAPPLPEAGETTSFRYARAQGDQYLITPTDGSQSYLVPTSFLQVTLNNSQLDNSQKAELLQAHPALMQGMFTAAYPDGTVRFETPFTPQSFQGTDGTQVRLEQDPLAGPYVRVQLTGGTEPARFSIARATAEQILANKQLTDDQRLQGLRSFPFRLPEEARAGNFAQLSAADLARLVKQEPRLGQYQFVQMATPPSTASRSVAQILPRPQLPFQVSDSTVEQPQSIPGTYPPSSGKMPRLATGTSLSHVVGAEAVDAHGVSTSAWHWAPYIIALGLFVLGLISIIALHRRQRV
ncbi:MAG: hypothetical protein KGL32_01215 [candidate division NC10 bacterium]|nr:hypothetical protein [candidate division NC10 bacterium]